jgi:hypothetical protein
MTSCLVNGGILVCEFPRGVPRFNVCEPGASKEEL